MIETIAPFEILVKEYDQWFQKHKYAYESEIEVIKRLLPQNGLGIELSVNTGRFASALGIKKGIEYYHEMKTLAEGRGIEVFESSQENMPFDKEEFDYALIVDIAYLENIKITLEQAHRIIKPGGKLILGFIEKNSPLGIVYQTEKQNSPFYKEAKYFTITQVNDLLYSAGFRQLEYMQTLFGKNLDEIKSKQIPKEGFGNGSFVTIKSTRL